MVDASVVDDLFSKGKHNWLFVESNVTQKNISVTFALDHYVISPNEYFGGVQTPAGGGIDCVADRRMSVQPAGARA